MNFSKSAFFKRLPEFVCAALLGAFGLLITGCATAKPERASEQEIAVSTPFPGEMSKSLEGVFAGKAVSYSAKLETTAIQLNVPGKGADIVSFSYVADEGDADRPVLFVFNGGPISASLWLHIGALGPYRLSLPDNLSASATGGLLVPNPYSPLGVADIVFFDPASTGYSRVREGVDRSVYFTVEADAAQCADFIEAWLSKHERGNAPVFILGESYGTIRAAEVAGQLAERGPDHAAAGVFLMGQAVNIIEYSQRLENIISYVVSLPTLAATAWDKGRAVTQAETFEAFMAEAEAFGETEYLTALFQGNRVAPAMRADIAAKLEGFTGIPAAYYITHNLRITKEAFRVELLKEEGLILGRSDARYTGPAASGADPSGTLQSVYEKAFGTYIQFVFGFPVGEEYRPYAAPEVWAYGPPSPFAHFAFGKRLDPAFEANPNFRLMIGNGYHDTMTTVGAAEYAVSQSNWPTDRVRTAYYQGGHMAYSVEESAKDFGADVREWITGRGDVRAGE